VQHLSVATGECEPIHSETLTLSGQDFRVFRCSWGWCVKRGEDAFRSRMLLEAFEAAWGTRADEPVIRTLVATIERALNSEYDQKAATVSTVVSLPDG